MLILAQLARSQEHIDRRHQAPYLGHALALAAQGLDYADRVHRQPLWRGVLLELNHWRGPLRGPDLDAPLCCRLTHNPPLTLGTYTEQSPAADHAAASSSGGGIHPAAIAVRRRIAFNAGSLTPLIIAANSSAVGAGSGVAGGSCGRWHAA